MRLTYHKTWLNSPKNTLMLTIDENMTTTLDWNHNCKVFKLYKKQGFIEGYSQRLIERKISRPRPQRLRLSWLRLSRLGSDRQRLLRLKLHRFSWSKRGGGGGGGSNEIIYSSMSPKKLMMSG